MRRHIPILACLLTLLASVDLPAQTLASPFVPVDHWSLAVVDRLHALGLAPPGTGRGVRSRSVAEVHALLESAAAAGDALAGAWLRRFEQELGSGGERTSLTHASAAAGASHVEGAVAPGLYTTWGEENWTGARARAHESAVAGRSALLGTAGGWLAAGAVAAHDAERSRIAELYAASRIGWLGVWGGRRLHGFGPGTSGLVLDGRAPVDGAGLFLAEPVRLPWLLRHLGPVRAEVAVGLLDPNGPVEEPWFVMTRGSVEPHPRFGVGVTRGGMIGPDEGGRSVGDVLFFLVGGQTDGSEYDNQVVSVDGWLRIDAGTLPLLLYLEWAAEDAAGGWWDVPAILGGVEVPSVPGIRWLRLGVERVTFTRSGSGNPPWYRHPIGFHEGWTSRGELFGHPLGGHGRELLVSARATLLAARLELNARGFTRVRGSENLYAPERTGRSNGIALGLDADIARGLSLQLSGSTEHGSDWRESRLNGLLQLYLPR